MTSQDTSIHETRVRYRVTGMDCASCASRIKNALGHVDVGDPQVSTATQILTFDASATSSDLDTIESAVTDLGYQLERIDAGQASTGTGEHEKHGGS
ncbi:MAG: hypothetical protein HKN42_15810 [Granulosicoccus sp.]|nr:hypothetical protein [Granulosicoccus sp.]